MVWSELGVAKGSVNACTAAHVCQSFHDERREHPSIAANTGALDSDHDYEICTLRSRALDRG